MPKKTKRKTKKSDERRRVFIAVTESSPLPDLWREAMNLMSESPADLIALFVDDQRWHRAASLPFTREISKLSGSVAEFTAQRAEELNREAATRMQRRIEELATEARLAFGFEVLSESDQKRITELLDAAHNVLIAPSQIRSRPIYTHLSRCSCRLMLIEAPEEKQETREAP